jgi:hypothetical protein
LTLGRTAWMLFRPESMLGSSPATIMHASSTSAERPCPWAQCTSTARPRRRCSSAKSTAFLTFDGDTPAQWGLSAMPVESPAPQKHYCSVRGATRTIHNEPYQRTSHVGLFLMADSLARRRDCAVPCCQLLLLAHLDSVTYMHFHALQTRKHQACLRRFQAPGIVFKAAPCVSHVGKHRYGRSTVRWYSFVQSMMLRGPSGTDAGFAGHPPMYHPLLTC